MESRTNKFQFSDEIIFDLEFQLERLWFALNFRSNPDNLTLLLERYNKLRIAKEKEGQSGTGHPMIGVDTDGIMVSNSRKILVYNGLDRKIVVSLEVIP